MDLPDSSTGNPLLIQVIPQTMGELNARIGKLFHCMNGPPQAYFQMALEPRSQSEWEPFERLVYVSLVWRTPGRRSPETDAKLIGAMLEPFLVARQQVDALGYATPLLFWRRPIEFEEYIADDDSQKTRIACRVAIPGANLSHFAQLEGELIKTL